MTAGPDEAPPAPAPRDMAKTTKPRIIRKMGCLERYQAALHALDMYYGTSIACVYRIPQRLASASQAEVEGSVHSAIARTVLQHPVLQVGIYGETSRKPAYVQLDTVDLKRHVQWKTAETGEDFEGYALRLLQEQIDTKFSELETRPPWRITVLRQKGSRDLQINFVWHHALADGMSGKIFHQTLLGHLTSDDDDRGGRASTESLVLDVAGAAKRFHPPQEKMVKYRVSMGYTLSTLWKDILPSTPGSASHQLLAHWAPLELEPPKTDIYRVRLNNERLQVVLAACREHNTTLTGLLHAIMVVAVSSSVSQSRSPGFIAKTAMNMRVLTPESPNLVPRETMGDIVSVTGHTFAPETVTKIRNQVIKVGASHYSGQDRRGPVAEVIWPTATTVRDEIKKALSSGVKDNIIGLMSFVPDWRQYNKSTAKKPREVAWVITNLGVIDGGAAAAEANGRGNDGDEDRWHIEEASFSINGQTTGAAISLCAIAVKHRDLALDFCFQRDLIASDTAAGVARTVEDWLTYFGTEGGQM
ncbi:alcohol acetyltransferase [Purpureocillium lavendulum]|uniref:Alcohol acetyltransferase n=1 Tax=Purpureocillium lavendulum TaxID=1247861 RepID=A0AB34G2L2_9HYPO|nr:alcohol acetyltransferase [Purpureocillium lavendulum]